MKRFYLTILGGAALALSSAVLTPLASAQEKPPPVKPVPLEMQGRIVRVANDQFVIETRDKKEIVFVTNPQTKFILKDKPGRFADLRVGANITAAYAREGDRYIVNTVTLVDDSAPVDGTLIEGEVVRVIGQDQVVLRSGGKEVIVFVDPKTVYLFEEKPGKFVDIRVGAPISVRYEVLEKRNVARNIVGPIRRR